MALIAANDPKDESMTIKTIALRGLKTAALATLLSLTMIVTFYPDL